MVSQHRYPSTPSSQGLYAQPKVSSPSSVMRRASHPRLDSPICTKQTVYRWFRIERKAAIAPILISPPRFHNHPFLPVTRIPRFSSYPNKAHRWSCRGVDDGFELPATLSGDSDDVRSLVKPTVLPRNVPNSTPSQRRHP